MSVDTAEVERIAALARLRLEPGEVERLTGELNGILAHMTTLDRIGDAGVEDVAVGSDALPSARASEAGDPDGLGAGPASFAPRWTDGFFVVPAPPGVQSDGDAA